MNAGHKASPSSFNAKTTPPHGQSNTPEEHIERARRPHVVAGKAPSHGASLGAAYFLTLAAGQYNSARSNLDTSRVQTNHRVEKAAEVRAAQAVMKGSYTPSHIIKNAGLEAKASFYEAIGSYSGGGISLSQNARNAFSMGGNVLVNKAQGAFASHEDMGSQVVGGGIATGVTAYAGIKAVQAASPLIINTVRGLPSSGQRIVSGAAQIQSRVNQAARGIQTGVVTTTNAVKRSYTLVRGMVNGTVMSSVVAHQALLKASVLAKGAGLKGLRLASRGVVHGAVKGGVWTFKSGLPKTAKGARGLSTGVAGALSSSNDMMLQGVGNTVTLANYGIKTSIIAGRMTGRVVKTSVKGAAGAAKSISFIRQKGLRAAWARARNKAATAAVNAGKSAISAVLNLVKVAGQKVIVPILIIALLASSVMSVLSAPVAAIGSIFSGLFDTDNGDGTYSETDIREFITRADGGIPALRADYINNLASRWENQLISNGGAFEEVRFHTIQNDETVDANAAGITSVFYTDDEIANILQPIFNAVVLMEYDLKPTGDQANNLLKELFSTLFGVSEAESTETKMVTRTLQVGESLGMIVTSGYCNCVACCGIWSGGLTASGTIPTANHTIAIDAVSPIVPMGTKIMMNGIEYTVEDTGNFARYGVAFDVYYDGHAEASAHGHQSVEAYLAEGNQNTVEVTTETEVKILTVTLNMDGSYQLLYKYFEQPIDQLANKTNRTEAEDKELSNLKDTYAICLEYIGQVSTQYGGGMTMQDLSGVQWVNGSRVGNQAVVDLALSQVGQVGGKPYWSYYGFGSRVAWCACFVHWVMNTGGNGAKYAQSSNNAYCPTLASWFASAGRWAGGGFTDIVAGDAIFFDWQGDGTTDHIGIVIGRDDTYVYTVEGNSSDSVRVKQYAINSSVIYGYGLMNY